MLVSYVQRSRYKGQFSRLLCHVAVLDNIPESNEDILGEELMKTKQKLKDITSALETQHMLLRLVVQVRSSITINFVAFGRKLLV